MGKKNSTGQRSFGQQSIKGGVKSDRRRFIHLLNIKGGELSQRIKEIGRPARVKMGEATACGRSLFSDRSKLRMEKKVRFGAKEA